VTEERLEEVRRYNMPFDHFKINSIKKEKSQPKVVQTETSSVQLS